MTVVLENYGIEKTFVYTLIHVRQYLGDQAALFRGYPNVVRTDNGPEITSRAFMGWAQSHGIRHILIEPGRPMLNGYIESFNGKFRDECLNDHWFETLPQNPGNNRRLTAGLQRGSPSQQLPTDAARQVRRFASEELCRCKATQHRKNPLTLQPDYRQPIRALH